MKEEQYKAIDKGNKAFRILTYLVEEFLAELGLQNEKLHYNISGYLTIMPVDPNEKGYRFPIAFLLERDRKTIELGYNIPSTGEIAQHE